MRTTTRPAIAARARPATTILLAAATLATLALSGCSPTVALQPAEDAINPVCAQVVVGVPDTVAGLEQRILRCGVPVPPPTAEYPCFTVDGVDWLRNSDDAPNYVFTTYGRDPAIEVIVNGDAASGSAALMDLAFAVTVSPKQGECIAATDILE
jgi:Protein of unknown function (DUF3515)